LALRISCLLNVTYITKFILLSVNFYVTMSTIFFQEYEYDETKRIHPRYKAKIDQ
jgi:hypothetical protein